MESDAHANDLLGAWLDGLAIDKQLDGDEPELAFGIRAMTHAEQVAAVPVREAFGASAGGGQGLHDPKVCTICFCFHSHEAFWIQVDGCCINIQYQETR